MSSIITFTYGSKWNHANGQALKDLLMDSLVKIFGGYSSLAAVLVVSCKRGVLSQGVSRVSPYSHHHSHRWVGALLISTFKDTLQRQGWVVKQISFAAGVRSLNEPDLRDNLTKWKDLRDNLKIISIFFTVTKELTMCRSQGQYKTLTTRKQKEKR